MKWTELTTEQRNAVIDYNCIDECIEEDVYKAAEAYRATLKLGEDAVFLRIVDLIDWWDNCDDETQQDILECMKPIEPPKTD